MTPQNDFIELLNQMKINNDELLLRLLENIENVIYLFNIDIIGLNSTNEKNLFICPCCHKIERMDIPIKKFKKFNHSPNCKLFNIFYELEKTLELKKHILG